jgi:hypothetical protein
MVRSERLRPPSSSIFWRLKHRTTFSAELGHHRNKRSSTAEGERAMARRLFPTEIRMSDPKDLSKSELRFLADVREQLARAAQIFEQEPDETEREKRLAVIAASIECIPGGN